MINAHLMSRMTQDKSIPRLVDNPALNRRYVHTLEFMQKAGLSTRRGTGVAPLRRTILLHLIEGWSSFKSLFALE